MNIFRRLISSGVVFIAFCAVTSSYIYVGKVTGHTARINSDRLPPDALQFIANSQQYFSKSSTSVMSAASNKTLREPAFPFLLNLGFEYSVSPSTYDYECLIANGLDCSQHRLEMKRLMGLLMIILGLSVAYIAWQFSNRSRSIAYSSLLITSGSGSLWLSTTQLLSEPLAAVLLVWTCYLFYLATIRDNALYACVLGLVAALLVLTKVVFMPLLLLFPISYFAVRKGNTSFKRFLIRSFTPMMAVFVMMIGGWQMIIHNQVAETPFGRGTSVLSARANYNLMTPSEYAGSFIYWSSGTGEKVAKKLLSSSAYANLDRDNPKGYFKRRNDVSTQGDVSPAMQIVQSPFKHLAVSIPIFYRGLFVESSFKVGRDFLASVGISSALLIGPFLFFGFFACCFRYIKANQLEKIAFAVPVLYSIAVHTLITHNIPRYGYPLIPVLILFSLLYVRAKLQTKVLTR